MLLQFVKNLAAESAQVIDSAAAALIDELQELRRRALTYKGAAKGRVTPRQKEIEQTLNLLNDKDKTKRDLFTIQYAQEFNSKNYTLRKPTLDYILNSYFEYLSQADARALGKGGDFVENIKAIFSDSAKIGKYFSFAPEKGIAQTLKKYVIETLSDKAYKFADCEEIVDAAKGAKIYGTIPPVYWFLFKKDQELTEEERSEYSNGNYLSAAFSAHSDIRQTLADVAELYFQGLEFSIKARFAVTNFAKGNRAETKTFYSVESFSDYVDPTLYDNISPKRGDSKDIFSLAGTVSYNDFRNGVRRFLVNYYISLN